MLPLSVFLYGVIILLFLFFQFQLISSVLFYFDNHIYKAKTYFDRYGLKVLKTRKPYNSEWNLNPFREKDFSPFAFRLVIFPSLYFIKHHVVEVSNVKSSETEIYWMQAKSYFFKKNEVNFQIQMREGNQDEGRSNIIKVSNICPACSFELKDNFLECPECGLSFN